MKLVETLSLRRKKIITVFLFSRAQDPASSDSEGGGPKVGSVKSHLRNRRHYFRCFS